MFSAASVCLSVCLFVCPHDNFPTIKRRTMKLGGYERCAKILLEFEFEVKGQRSRSPGTKKRQSAAFSAAVLVRVAGVAVGGPRHHIRQ